MLLNPRFMKLIVVNLLLARFITAAVILTGSANSQVCLDQYSSNIFTGSTYDTFTTATVTKDNEILAAGTLFDYNEAGRISKYSARGTPLWSSLYNITFFDFNKGIFFKAIRFSEMISTADGGCLLSGHADQVLSTWVTPPLVKKHALLAKIDKYGKVTWNKTISNARGDVSFSNILETSDGDFIAYMATDNKTKTLPGDHTYGRVFRVDPGGKIKWSSLLFTYLFDAGGFGISNKRALTQGRNNNIIVGDVVHKTDPLQNFKVMEGNLHFVELDYTTGKVNWESSYEYPVPASDRDYTPSILNVSELPGGQLSFITSLYLTSNNSTGLTKQGANIITTARGSIEKIIAYSSQDGSPANISHVATRANNAERTLLFNKPGNAMLVHIDAAGDILWKEGYGDDAGNFPANCVAASQQGFNIFMSNNRSFKTRLLITDAAGSIDCVNTPADIITLPAILNYSQDSVRTNTEIAYDNYFENDYTFARTGEYPVLKQVDCQQTLACCTDMIDSSRTNNISLCEGKSFLLPDSTVITTPGSYYVTFKTALGCDSIVFYSLKIDKEISRLSLGGDTCLGGPGTIQLNPTQGYDQYYWMNTPTPDSSVYTVQRPGTYWVKVSNSCGTNTDSITIYEQCDYPVYMPSAFTPNGDYLNDYFRVPPSNKNKLIRLRIFNRWGTVVFQTSNALQGWDGSFKNEPLPSDAFNFILEMEGYSGNKFTQKGTVLLVR